MCQEDGTDVQAIKFDSTQPSEKGTRAESEIGQNRDLGSRH